MLLRQVLRKRKGRAIKYHAETLHRRLDVLDDEDDDEVGGRDISSMKAQSFLI